jgi:hypothetical protein
VVRFCVAPDSDAGNTSHSLAIRPFPRLAEIAIHELFRCVLRSETAAGIGCEVWMKAKADEYIRSKKYLL